MQFIYQYIEIDSLNIDFDICITEKKLLKAHHKTRLKEEVLPPRRSYEHNTHIQATKVAYFCDFQIS